MGQVTDVSTIAPTRVPESALTFLKLPVKPMLQYDKLIRLTLSNSVANTRLMQSGSKVKTYHTRICAQSAQASPTDSPNSFHKSRKFTVFPPFPYLRIISSHREKFPYILPSLTAAIISSTTSNVSRPLFFDLGNRHRPHMPRPLF